MTDRISASDFRGLLYFGLKNLKANRDRINALNVFPVPDGDTGTNMVLTLSSGIAAAKEGEDMPTSARAVADAVVFGARGNSGVILSQFFRGFCLGLADGEDLSAALQAGVRLAYGAVSNPVEGTMLTVLRHACAAAKKDVEICQNFGAILAEARESLAHTPELLPILASAGVVDSGGEGVVCIFEGMHKYLLGEDLDISAPEEENRGGEIDFSRFDRNSAFEYGYCTELLLQFTSGSPEFDPEDFNRRLAQLGDSIVTALQSDKLKIHIHSFAPEKVLELAHRYGEFLSLKIENMSVQHHSQPASNRKTYGTGSFDGPFAIVCAAHTDTMAELFTEFGAGAVIPAQRGCPPAASDFIAALERVPAPVILVFPNSKNAVPVALQAAELFTGSRVLVFPTHSDTECYATLPMLDFSEADPEVLQASISEIIENITTVSISRASRAVTLDGIRVTENDFAAMKGSRLLGVGPTPVTAAMAALEKLDEFSIARIFADGISPEDIARLTQALTEGDEFIETEVVQSGDSACPIILSLE